MSKKKRQGTTLKVIKVLKHWEDADFFDLKIKKKVAKHIIEEIEEDFNPPERRL